MSSIPETDWLKLLGRWLLRTAAKHPKPLLEYERRTANTLDSKLSLLSEADIRFPRRPGAIASWNLIDRQAPAAGVFITLDNLLRLGAESHHPEIKKGLQRSQNLTHRFQVSWVVRRDKEKFHFVIIDAFDVDLANAYVDEAPKEIIRLVALEAFNMRSVPGLSWQERIYHFPWFNYLQYFSPKKGCPVNPTRRQLCRRMQKVTFS